MAQRLSCLGIAILYWDWSQDWKNMPLAPVWDVEGGFGGDGQRDTPITVGEGRCVSDGPFANVEAQYFGDEAKPHCLSRGFASDAHIERIGEPISPDALEELRERSTTFAEYAPELEHRAHIFMRDGVRGDFRAYTGPYDPVFFLHHVNIDRLWALWQTSATGGDIAYGGPRHDTAGASAATVDDVLNIGNLLPSVPVSAVIHTSNGFLCYQY
ncbi:uncharacterized protein N0V89_011194 [Didymosphaeria variabile]|uniref:Tyrosinase copper-binding domain-containing protein n=1 Tax=Didymosphaeria variabile TaxID=1932322 RepID=A0A9W9C6W5_9PLEO|nr:uncharacterized protein N0V89_011194 [Didymosphaeria variabile]KAJ4347254.1 hypothetical protein N0V89_011194 [Didymosphaeria variabile]